PGCWVACRSPRPPAGMPPRCWGSGNRPESHAGGMEAPIPSGLQGLLVHLRPPPRGTSGGRRMAQGNGKGRSGQVVTLVVIAVVLAAAYVGLDFYSEGERNKTVAESRGTQVVQALSRFKLEAGKYPEKL